MKSYASGEDDGESPINKVDLYIPDIKTGEYSFVYVGRTFTSIKGNISGANIQDGTIFRAVPAEQSRAYVKSWPDHYLSIVGHKLIYPGYWLQAANGNGINDGFRGVQVKFSENDAIGFLNSCNNIFGTNFKIRK